MSLKEFLDGTLKLAWYTLLLFFGRKEGSQEVEAKNNEAALKHADKAFENTNEVDLEFQNLRKEIPDSWDAVDRRRRLRASKSK